MKSKNLWPIIGALEVAAAAAAIILDLFIPTLIILALMAVSLLARRENLASLGLVRSPNGPRMVGFVLLSVLVWQLLQAGVTKPLLNRLTGATQDLAAFAALQGNLGQLALYLALTWTLAAFGEEIAYRGYLQKRLGDLFGATALGAALAVGLSSLLFGLAHTEQGLIGVILTTLDALFFSWLKHKYANNLWAAILAHGFSNSVGLIAVYFVGPIYGLW